MQGLYYYNDDVRKVPNCHVVVTSEIKRDNNATVTQNGN